MNKSVSIATLALPLCLGITGFAGPSEAQIIETPVEAQIISGWRMADGTHMAAIHLTLADGWKTYWRAPGDGGIPPQITWNGSRNLDAVEAKWPTPVVFDQNGMRSIGYKNQVIIPIHLAPKRSGKAIEVAATLEIGVCKDVCLPETLKVRGTLDSTSQKITPSIAAALAAQPYSAKEAQVASAACSLESTADGMRLSAEITMPSAGGREFSVIETNNPMLWVSETQTQRNGGTLRLSSEIVHVEEKPFLLSRDAIRITILGAHYGVDIQGCAAG